MRLRAARVFSFRRRRVLPPRDAYALWADSYPPLPHNPVMEAEQQVVAPMIAALAPARALDVGTGSGRYLPLLAATGARVVGVDFSLPMLGRGRRGVAARVCGDACRLPFRNASFDLVSSSLMVGDVGAVDVWAAEVARVLESGGDLIYSDFHPTWATAGWRRTFQTRDGRSYEVRLWPHAIAEHLAALARHGFDVKTIREPHVAVPGSSRRPQPVVVVFHAVKTRR